MINFDKLKKSLNFKNIFKSFIAILFSFSYLGYMKVGTEICNIDEKYGIYFCVGILFYIIFKYVYNVTIKYFLINKEMESEKQ